MWWFFSKHMRVMLPFASSLRLTKGSSDVGIAMYKGFSGMSSSIPSS